MTYLARAWFAADEAVARRAADRAAATRDSFDRLVPPQYAGAVRGGVDWGLEARYLEVPDGDTYRWPPLAERGG